MTARPVSRPAGWHETSLTALVLRVGTAACFIGHGSLGLLRTASWTSYFAVAGIGRESALALMPLVGALDVAMGISVLFKPIRAIVLYMVAWCVWTALLRPLAGESVWETVERAGNYGAPLALYLLMQGGNAKTWLCSRFHETLDESRFRRLGWVLRLTTVALLLGHGALGVIVRKPMLSAQYHLIGLHGAGVEPLIGGFECMLALAVLLKPEAWLLFGVIFWKLATEALCPLTGSPIWVFIEHGGSYVAPLALALLPSIQRSAQMDFISSPQSRPEALIFD